MTDRTALAALALAFVFTAPAAAQVDELAQRCVTAGTATATTCQQFAEATRLAQVGTGLSLAGGNTFQGAASTLGRRFGATPRVALSLRGALTRFPVMHRIQGPSTGSFSGEYTVAPSVQGQVTVGVFDGFSPAPTVGGLFAVDLLAHAGVAFLPDGRGFLEGGGGWGYGVRLGILRESFTLPGVTFSASQTRGSGVDFDGGTLRLHLDEVVTTSLRLVVGKELMIGGLLAGAGWDRYGTGSGEMAWGAPVLGTPPPPTSIDDFDSSRLLFFGGWSRTFLILQFSGEVGWARGFGDETPLFQGFDMGSSSFFGSLSLRLTI